MTETEGGPLPVVAKATDESLRTAARVGEKPEKDELPAHLKPDPTLTMMARNVSW